MKKEGRIFIANVVEGFTVGVGSTWGFVQVGQTECTSAFVLLSSAARADGILSANEQIIDFFILNSADGFGQTDIEFPTYTKPCSLAVILADPTR